MTRDDIIRMAREAGSIDSDDVIETVYAAFAAAERTALRAALEQQVEPEPVAWMVVVDGGTSAYVTDNPTDFVMDNPDYPESAYRALPLYTAPPQRKPLTDDEILEMVRAAPDLGSAEDEWLHVARAIEQAHGIGEEE